jgi:CheY-like chemotaxis protein
LIDPHQLELALLNLALNARDAMPNGGRLSIRAYRDEGAGLTVGLPGSEFVCAVVTDSGSGMDETTLKRATEPFFTTKGVGKGTGLGLPMVHGMVTQSGGAMQISSQAGQGTSVRLWIPVDHTGPLPRSEAPEVLMQSVVPCRIMVVDDDPLILSSAAAMLEDLGHVVIEASSAASALEILCVDREVDVVLTDYAMPAMTGAELAEIVRRQWPWMPIILASGYADLQETGNLPRHRLAKPFKQAELALCIASVLEDRKVVPIEAARRA